jgi:hypothetical protein
LPPLLFSAAVAVALSGWLLVLLLLLLLLLPAGFYFCSRCASTPSGWLLWPHDLLPCFRLPFNLLLCQRWSVHPCIGCICFGWWGHDLPLNADVIFVHLRNSWHGLNWDGVPVQLV